MEYIGIKENIIIRKIKDKIALINYVNGCEWELTSFQYRLLNFCKGNLTKEEIINKFKNKIKAKKIIDLLINNKIIFINHYKKKEKKIIETKSSPYLYRIHLEITGKCNFRCKHCYNSNFDGKTDLNTPKIIKLINDISKGNITRMQISGGEPFLRKDLFRILSKIEKEKICLDAIFSNGSRITKKMSEKIKKLPWKVEIIISLDGATKKSNNKLRGKNTFSKIVRGIKDLEKFEIPIAINTMLHKGNIHESKKLYHLISNIKNLERWRIGTPHLQGRYIKNSKKLSISLKDKLKFFSQILKEYLSNDDQKRFVLELEDSFNSKILKKGFTKYFLKDHPCKYATNMCTIKPNGDVTVCPSREDIIFGNIKQKRINKIWKSKKFSKFRALKIEDLKECKICKYVHICGGGCRANAERLTGDDLSKDEIACETMKWIERIKLPKSIKSQFNFLKKK